MKKILLIIFLLWSWINIYATTTTSIASITSGTSTITVAFTLPTYSISDTNIYEVYGINQNYSFIDISGFGQICDVGYPNLPQYTISLQVPSDATTYSVAISNLVTETKTLTYNILPFEDTTGNKTSSFLINSSYYSSTGSRYAFKYQISDTFNIMGANGINFSIFPFQYNPSTKQIVVIKSCTFTITHNGSSSSTLKSTSVDNTITNEFLSNFFENYQTLKSGSTSKGNYLIITAPDYKDDLTYFANYKRNIGYDVTIVTTATTGTTATLIKDYIQDLYNTSSTRPNFVLLVGDVDAIPPSEGSTSSSLEDEDLEDDMTHPITDLDYSLLDGDDYYADVFLGRIPVSSSSQLQNIINKTIYMETNLHSMTKTATLLAGSGDDEDIFTKVQTDQQEILEYYGYTCTPYYGTDGATDSDGQDAINADNVLFIYYGHGSYQYIGSPFYIKYYDFESCSNSVYPFGFGFSCLTNCYGNSSEMCFGQGFIDFENGGVTYYGASTLTYTKFDKIFEPMIVGEIATNDVCISEAIYIGIYYFKSTLWGSSSTNKIINHLKTYNLLGDPSIYYNGIGCQDDYYLTNNEEFHDGDKITYQASDLIEAASDGATFEAQAGSTVNLIAGTKVTLKAGTAIKSGTSFTASIGECSSSTTKSATTSSYNTDETNTTTSSVLSTENLSNVVTIFPNPTINNLSLYFYINANKLNKISVYDIYGKLIIDKDISELSGNTWNKVELNTIDIAQGTYMYIISFEGGSEKGKFVKL